MVQLAFLGPNLKQIMKLRGPIWLIFQFFWSIEELVKDSGVKVQFLKPISACKFARKLCSSFVGLFLCKLQLHHFIMQTNSPNTKTFTIHHQLNQTQNFVAKFKPWRWIDRQLKENAARFLGHLLFTNPKGQKLPTHVVSTCNGLYPKRNQPHYWTTIRQLGWMHR